MLFVNPLSLIALPCLSSVQKQPEAGDTDPETDSADEAENSPAEYVALFDLTMYQFTLTLCLVQRYLGT